jgi:uncharacterized membrane protein (DUF485 family)
MDDHEGSVDWESIERSPEFRELVAARRRFVLPATIFFLAWYLCFVLLCGYAPDFMGESVYQGLTVGYVLALTQFIMVWVLCGMYLRRADSTFDPLAQRVVERVTRAGALSDTGADRGRAGHFEHEGDAAGPRKVEPVREEQR